MSELILIEKAFFLKKTALFSEVDLDLLLAISDKVDVYEFDKGDFAFSYNQEAKSLYVIFSGTVDILDENDVIVTTLGHFDFFGDEAIYAHTPRNYSARISSDAQLIVISRSHINEIILEAPQVALALIRAYATVTPIRKRLV